ncbi:hypothetical protein FF38_00854 [Lucilia cuprina]|uniref:Uncharacterized protein n=1 Tax=Lucilia cuprina TaxID=7375 RepID=A0A0L0C253_LUCCU|nr:hypothetical protein FF38_00854 [Lucilia cuprina]
MALGIRHLHFAGTTSSSSSSSLFLLFVGITGVGGRHSTSSSSSETTTTIAKLQYLKAATAAVVTAAAAAKTFDIFKEVFQFWIRPTSTQSPLKLNTDLCLDPNFNIFTSSVPLTITFVQIGQTFGNTISLLFLLFPSNLKSFKDWRLKRIT